MDQNTPPRPNFSQITGPPFLGLILNWGLFGILSTQVYIYYQAFPKDRLVLKLLICSTYLMEIVQIVIFTQTLWRWYVDDYGQIEVFKLGNVGPNWLAVTLIGGIVAFMVQTFYAYRIKLLSQCKILPGIIMLMALVSLGGALAISINSALVKFFHLAAEKRSRLFPVVGVWQGAGSGCDVLIALCMIYQLRRLSRQGELTIQPGIIQILRFTVETGTLTAALSVLSLVLVYAAAPLPYWQVPLSCIAKIYSNTMLAVANSRIRLKAGLGSKGWGDFPLSRTRCDMEQNVTTFASMSFAAREDATRNGPESNIVATCS